MAYPTPTISRYSLRLRIDPYTIADKASEGATSTAAWPEDSSGDCSFESPSGTLYERLCVVRCLYDFDSPQADHLSFKQGDVLQIVKKENGWWAATRNDGAEVGWVPASYVRVIDEEVRAANEAQESRSPPPSYHDVLHGMRSAPPSFVDSFSPSVEGSMDYSLLGTVRVVRLYFIVILDVVA